jgi:Kef-type K+ transport system membrane component KefB
MDYLLFFLIIIGAAFLLPELAKKIHIPYVTSIILAGILIGPYGFKLLDLGEIASFLAFLGAIFLMFTAGLDVKLSSLRKIGKKSIIIALFNGIIPFITGYYIANFFGYNSITSLILGAIFVSSSVAIIIPSLKETKLADTDLGKIIISSTVFEDVTSLLILAFLLQHISLDPILPFVYYIPLVLVSLILLFFLLPRLQKFFIKQKKETQKEDVFEGELRFIIIVLIITALLFELLGIHAIIAGFFVGLFLSDAIKHRLVSEKIYTISYGIFIPIFFLVIGMKTNILSFLTIENIIITGTIVFGLIIAKFISGFLGSLVAGNSKHESLIVASATIPQLSTTLVVALVAEQVGLFDGVLLTSIIVLSIITTLISPFLIKFFHRKLEKNLKKQQLDKEKHLWGVKKETKQLKKKEKRIKQKERKVKVVKEKAEKEKEDIKKHKKEIKGIKKVIKKKNKRNSH